jgi:hypothetical protein
MLAQVRSPSSSGSTSGKLARRPWSFTRIPCSLTPRISATCLPILTASTRSCCAPLRLDTLCGGLGDCPSARGRTMC